MAQPLVECIPNYSEARRPEVVNEIIEALSAVPGIHVLDRHSDIDHNRTVVTFVGPPSAVEEAAYQSIVKAATLIDLEQHTGEHPRIGATDVVPFVPLSDFSMVECVEMARRLGKRVADTLDIPVYLYEEAATNPDRHNLENVRRGQYEGLKQEIRTSPERKPDFGPSVLGKAGATVIGARQPLIAFNVYLTTDDVSIAQKIAKSIRQSSGGWRYIKAMGVLVEGRAQVSMNMTNFHQTPMARVVESIRREAQRYGVGVHHSELVGLIPQKALTDAAIWYLQLDAFKADQVLETRMYDALRETPPVAANSDFTDDLAAGTPTPGGGSASAYSSAMGAALVCMVSRLTIGKKKYLDVEPRMWKILEIAEPIHQELLSCVEKDSHAFNTYLEAVRLPKDKPEEELIRTEAINAATLLTAEVPMQVCKLSLQVMQLALELADTGNLNAISDAASGFGLAQAGFKGAAWNVKINLKDFQGKVSESMLSELYMLGNQVTIMEHSLQQIMRERGGLA